MGMWRLTSAALVVAGLASAAGAAWAENDKAADSIEQYREALRDGNPAELFEAQGEELWKTKAGPKNASAMVTSMSYPAFLDPSADAADANFQTIGRTPLLSWVSIGHSPYTDGRRLWMTPMQFD